MSAKAPIGIFDSGIGGLTIAKAINDLMPHESLIYFGDTRHMPYGDKSAESIRHYSAAIAQFLKMQGAKALVIACNTASAVGHKAAAKAFGKAGMVVNVIDPVVKHLAELDGLKRVGIIGTRRTIQAKAYSRRLNMHRPDIQAAEMATPLLAPMIEEGFFNNKISRTIIREYLGKSKLKGIEALVPGCTHYPLIYKEILEYYPESVKVLDAPAIVAGALKKVLTESGLLISKGKPEHRFYISEYTQSFAATARIFFGKSIALDHYPLWNY